MTLPLPDALRVVLVARGAAPDRAITEVWPATSPAFRGEVGAAAGADPRAGDGWLDAPPRSPGWPQRRVFQPHARAHMLAGLETAGACRVRTVAPLGFATLRPAGTATVSPVRMPERFLDQKASQRLGGGLGARR